MQPIGLLMTEHRRIERVVRVMKSRVEEMEASGTLDVAFIDRCADFFLNYADRVHHGKEEDILFDGLSRKDLSDQHHRTMGELVEEHIRARKLVGDMLLSRKLHEQGDTKALREALACARELVAFYPRHVRKEDTTFFHPVMAYFDSDESDAMVRAFAEFDRKQIHARYESLIEELEKPKV